MPFTLPSSDTAEVTLIGTGGGYGESVVIHLGNNEWVIVDSCQNPNTKESLPLLYLNKIGVDVEKKVKLIICTHWHDDHLLGLTQLLEAAKNANFCFTEATDKKKFLQLVELDYAKLDREASNSSTLEFGNCLEVINERKSRIILAKENTTLYGVNISSSIRCEVIALSPSDQTILNFNTEISSLITEFGESRKKIIIRTPNEKSIAIFLKLGCHRAILGADLELSANANEGWMNILDNNKVIDKKSSLFKISHHGSENGYHIRIWEELLEENPVSKLTPWNKNSRLPTAEMLQVYSNHTDKLYMTAPVISLKPKKRDKSIDKIIKSLKCKIHEVKYAQGIIQCRNNLNTGTKWTVETLEGALKV
jgi:beta-lactamase superfamily II metal-dependent hydrolase